MKHWRVLGVALLLPASAAHVTAQVPAAIEFPHGASSAAMGSTGAGMWGREAAMTLNPAVTGSLTDFSLQSALSSSRGADESGFSIRGILPVGVAVASMEYRHKSVSDLIEDPAIDETGFGVSDNNLRFAVGRRLGSRVAIGIAANLGWSNVFDTDGSSHFFGLGLVGRPLDGFTLGASMRRLGGSLRWSAPGGATSSVDVPVGYRFGVMYEGLTAGTVSFLLAGDVEAGSGLGGTEMAFGVEANYRSIAFARVGLRSPAAVDSYWTTGFGLRFTGIDAAFSYELIDVVGPRLQFEVGVTPADL